MKIHDDERLLGKNICEKMIFSHQLIKNKRLMKRFLQHSPKPPSYRCYALNFFIFKFWSYVVPLLFSLPTFFMCLLFTTRGWKEKSTIWEVENVNSFFVGGWKIYDVARVGEREENLSTMRINRSILCNHFKGAVFRSHFNQKHIHINHVIVIRAIPLIAHDCRTPTYWD